MIRSGLLLTALITASLLARNIEPARAQGDALCTVQRIIDGDTFDCTSGRRVHMLGIEAPGLSECGGDWARSALANIFLPPGRTVRLTLIQQDPANHHLAAPIWVGNDGAEYNLSIVMAYVGLARASTNQSADSLAAWAIASETWARVARWNMWAPGGPFSGSCVPPYSPWPCESCSVDSMVRGIRVRGDQGLFDRTREALDLLGRYPDYLAFVQEHVQSVVLVSQDSRMDLVQQEFRVTRLFVFIDDAGHSREDAIYWYAAALVHESQHVEQHWTGMPSFGADAENDADRKSLEFLRRAGGPESQIAWIEELIRCRDASGCNTWDLPHEY